MSNIIEKTPLILQNLFDTNLENISERSKKSNLAPLRMMVAYLYSKHANIHPKIIGDKLQRDRTTILYYLDTADYAIEGKYPLLKEMIQRSEEYLLTIANSESLP
jgi:hypothetical protein